MSGQASGYFTVAVETLQRGHGTELVASGAIGCAGQRLMRSRERSGRNLRPCRRRKQREQNYELRFEQEWSQPAERDTRARKFSNQRGRFPWTG